MAGEARHIRGAGRLVRRRDAGGRLTLVELDVSPDLAASYRAPGQYLALELPAKRSYLALAGDPQAARWTLLVRQGAEAGDAIEALPIGASVELSGALGSGFPLPLAAGRRLIIVATGGALAAVRPVIRARIAAGMAASTEVLLGVRSRVDVPLSEEVESTRAEGVALTLCCSREAVEEPGATTGYVQAALLRCAAAEPSLRSGALVFAAGSPAMIAAVREALVAIGLEASDLHTNL